ncbi:hypothetical protein [Phocaeicola dorei]|uniref:hypothetical protein n=1 Tax=Phocaeicola dorei TaxID=357276 RepID=UPI00397B708C
MPQKSFKSFSLSANALFIGILAEELIPRNLSAWKKSFSRKAHEQSVCGEAETSEGKNKCFAMCI